MARRSTRRHKRLTRFVVVLGVLAFILWRNPPGAGFPLPVPELPRPDPPARERPAEPGRRQADRGPLERKQRDTSAAPRGTLACVVAVDGIRDGDTIGCEGGERVRLLQIDAPELGQRPAGADARDALRALVPDGTRVRLETDVRERDRHGRILAFAYLRDGRMVNLEMARSGYAVPLVYAPNVRHAERIRAAAAQARAARRGLWRTDGFACEPRDWRAGRCGRTENGERSRG